MYEAIAPAGIEMVPIEYPGRGARMKEPLITEMHALVDCLYKDLKREVMRGDYALYGHSMGGIVAFFLAKKILADKLPEPLHLFITGTTGPSSKAMEEKMRFRMGKQEFIDEIKFLDGCPEEILQNHELLEYFEPILRADFEVSETFSYETDTPVNIPFTVVTGTEEDMKEEDIRAWQKESCYPVDFRKMPGRHFFIQHHPREILDMIVRKLVNIYKIN